VTLADGGPWNEEKEMKEWTDVRHSLPAFGDESPRFSSRRVLVRSKDGTEYKKVGIARLEKADQAVYEKGWIWVSDDNMIIIGVNYWMDIPKLEV
jgi:hypothetical protein